MFLAEYKRVFWTHNYTRAWVLSSVVAESQPFPPSFPSRDGRIPFARCHICMRTFAQKHIFYTLGIMHHEQTCRPLPQTFRRFFANDGENLRIDDLYGSVAYFRFQRPTIGDFIRNLLSSVLHPLYQLVMWSTFCCYWYFFTFSSNSNDWIIYFARRICCCQLFFQSFFTFFC